MYVNATQIGNKWDCRKSSAQSERRDICGIVAIRSGWKMVMECYTYLRNVQDLLSDWKTSNERRFGMLLSTDQQYHLVQRSIITLFLRKTYRDCINLVQKSCQVFSSVMFCTREVSGKGDILIADIEELEQMDASEIHARRLNAKEVSTPWKMKKSYFQVADGTVKTPRGDRRLRPSTLIRDRPERGEEQEVFRWESEGSSSTSRQDSSWYGEAQIDFLSTFRRFYSPSPRGTPSQTERADWSIIPNSTEVHWRIQRLVHHWRYCFARWKLEFPMPAATLCKISLCRCGRETCRTVGGLKTKYGCILKLPYLWESEWKELLADIMKITLQGRYEFIKSLQSGAQIYSYASRKENSRCKGCSGKIMGKMTKILAWQLTKVRNKREVIEEAKNKGKKIH